LDAERAGEDLKKLEMAYNEGVQDYEEGQTEDELAQEQLLVDRRMAARKALDEYKNQIEITLNDLGAWAKLIANAAQRWVHKNHTSLSTQGQDMKLYVDKGD
jgi:hypothetical protein